MNEGGGGAIIALYFSMMISGRDYPQLVGPYFEDRNECESVREWVDHLNFETSNCSALPLPQDGAILLHVFDIPRAEST